jgi:hypothetical protein
MTSVGYGGTGGPVRGTRTGVPEGVVVSGTRVPVRGVSLPRGEPPCRTGVPDTGTPGTWSGENEDQKPR